MTTLPNTTLPTTSPTNPPLAPHVNGDYFWQDAWNFLPTWTKAAIGIGIGLLSIAILVVAWYVATIYLAWLDNRKPDRQSKVTNFARRLLRMPPVKTSGTERKEEGKEEGVELGPMPPALPRRKTEVPVVEPSAKEVKDDEDSTAGPSEPDRVQKKPKKTESEEKAKTKAPEKGKAKTKAPVKSKTKADDKKTGKTKAYYNRT